MERLNKVKINDNIFAIVWRHTIDGKQWARIINIKTNEEFGKFRTKKEAKEYMLSLKI